MALTIVGEHKFPGRMLVTAMIKAQAAAKGGPAMKHAAGAGVLDKYLAAHTTRDLIMPGHIMLTTGVAVARASLCREDLNAAGEAIEKVTDVEHRRKLLADIVEPFFSNQETLFSSPFREGRKPNRIEAGVLAEQLEPELPALELTMDGFFKVASHNQVTYGQYDIFRAQTGHQAPSFWKEKYRDDLQQLNLPVVGINNVDDAPSFAAWLGRSIPTEAIFVNLGQKKGTYPAEIDWEWTSTMHEGESRVYSLRFSSSRPHDPTDRKTGWLGFRVAG